MKNRDIVEIEYYQIWTQNGYGKQLESNINNRLFKSVGYLFREDEDKNGVIILGMGESEGNYFNQLIIPKQCIKRDEDDKLYITKLSSEPKIKLDNKENN